MWDAVHGVGLFDPSSNDVLRGAPPMIETAAATDDARSSCW